MNAKEMLKNATAYDHKKRRKTIIARYRELKKLIKQRSKEGYYYIDLNNVRSNEIATAARLFFVKNNGFKIRVWSVYNECSDKWRCNRVYISWMCANNQSFEHIIKVIPDDCDE